MKYLKIVLTFVVLYILYSLPGFLFNNPEFYLNLKKPSFAFKPIVFAIVWPILFTIHSGYLTYKLQKKSLTLELKVAFIINYILMFLFDLTFFKFENIFLGFSMVLLSFSSGLLIFIYLLKINRYEASLFTPYLLWTLLATILSANIYFLN